MPSSSSKKVRLVLPSPMNIEASSNWLTNSMRIINDMNKVNLTRRGFSIRGSYINDQRFVRSTKPKTINSVNRPIGKLFLFRYTAEGKDEPDFKYYDRFPLLLLMSRDKNGFEGFNLHYIPIRIRLRIISRIAGQYVVGENSPEPRFYFKYDVVKNDPNLRYLKASYRRYTNKYMESLLFEIEPEHWGNILYMPFSMFIKDGNIVPNVQVWREQMLQVIKE